jgi:catechol 2,3-dioxygenase-like lactoylglutathione lyase family enzyme
MNNRGCVQVAQASACGPITVLLTALAFSTVVSAAVETAKPGLDVGVVITDAAKAKDFYGGVLGLKEAGVIPLPTGGTMIRYQSGASILKLLAYEKSPAVTGGPTRAAIGIRLITVYTTDRAGVIERAAQRGLKLELQEVRRGVSYGFLPDPDGNVIEVVTMLADTPAPAMQRIAIGLTVADAAKSRAFYSKVLGLEEQPPSDLPNNAGIKYTFTSGASIIKFWQAAAGTPVKTGGVQEGAGIRYFTFMVKDVDAAQAWLVERGAKIAMPPTDFGRLARIMFVADPDGNYIEFAGPLKPAK